MRVLTNSHWIDHWRLAEQPVEVVPLDRAVPWWVWLGRSFALWRYDAVLINVDAFWLFLLCAARKLLPLARCRMLAVDVIMTRPPADLKGRLRFHLRRWLLQEVDRFVLFQRDTAELRSIYRLAPERVHYVPFKVNTRPQVLALEPIDEGFFLSCGRSNRDYRTLCEALQGLPYRCVILVPQQEAAQHGTRLDGIECPQNVMLVSDDGSVESWNRWIARATAVVLPIEPGMLSPSGISTYLVAMALGKCVIITESASTRGILDNSTAVLVPPSNVGAMRHAIRRVAEDEAYRHSVAEGGRTYALSLGGEERLREDIRRELKELLKDVVPASSSHGTEPASVG